MYSLLMILGGTDRIIVIEINPRTSRSSALASKATGFPNRSCVCNAGNRLLTLGMIFLAENMVPWTTCTDGDYVVIKFARLGF